MATCSASRVASSSPPLCSAGRLPSWTPSTRPASSTTERLGSPARARDGFPLGGETTSAASARYVYPLSGDTHAVTSWLDDPDEVAAEYASEEAFRERALSFTELL